MLIFHNFKLFTSNRIILTLNDFTFDKDSFSYIQGHNSTGKSLLLKSIVCDYQNFKGNIYFNKQKISNFQDNIILINHDLPVIKSKTFLENIQLSIGKLEKSHKTTLTEMASILGLIEILNQKMEYSSRSERMFMYLLRAAIISPKVLMIDDLDDFFDFENFTKVYDILLLCIKNGSLVLCTGKSDIENTSSLIIKNGELFRNEL